jgi:hypothetical protein
VHPAAAAAAALGVRQQLSWLLVHSQQVVRELLQQGQQQGLLPAVDGE